MSDVGTHSADIIGLVWRGTQGFEEIRQSTDPVIKQPLERPGRRPRTGGEDGQQRRVSAWEGGGASEGC